MARVNLTMMPMSADDKSRVLHKLQGSIHFEKTLPATAANYAKKPQGLTIPSWFVQKHGDKFREFTILRTVSSTERWPVKLSISVQSPTVTQVRFGEGWLAFAISHGLWEGDSLIFVLMAMSEFKVYVFRSTEGPCKIPNPKRRRWTCDTDHSQKKAKRTYNNCRDVLLSADKEGSVEGKNGSNIESSAVSDGSIAPTPEPSCKEDSSYQLPSFWKTLTATNVGRSRQARLEIPRGFCRKYGNRIRSVVKLQGIHEQSPERTVACYTSFGKNIRHYLTSEWQDFVKGNQLHEGQQLLFTLSADSFFVVRERGAL